MARDPQGFRTSFTLYDGPAEVSFPGLEADAQSQFATMPMAALFQLGGGSFLEICRAFGYLMILGQELEFEIKRTLVSLEFRLMQQGKKPQYMKDRALRRARSNGRFVDLVNCFQEQLDMKDPGSNRLKEQLKLAREHRNELAHAFVSEISLLDLSAEGGRQKILTKLRLAESVFFPLISIMRAIGRGYDLDSGFTDQRMEAFYESLDDSGRMTGGDLQSLLEDVNEDRKQDH